MGDPGVLGSAVPPGPDAVWKKIADLEQRVQQALAQASSAAAFAAIAADQVALANAQLALAANQVSPTSAVTSVGSFNTTTTETGIASISFTVPTGYTRAVMFGTGSTTTTNFSGAYRYLYSRVNLSVSAGPEQAIYIQDFNTSPYADTVGNVSASHAYVATGLSGGGALTAALTTRSSGGSFGTNALNNATLAVSVLFLK